MWIFGKGKLAFLAQECFDYIGIKVDGQFDSFSPVQLSASDIVAVCVSSIPFRVSKKIVVKCGASKQNIIPIWDVLLRHRDLKITNGWRTGTIEEWEWRKISDVCSRLTETKSVSDYMEFLSWHFIHGECIRRHLNKQALPPLGSSLKEIWERQNIIAFPPSDEIMIHAEGNELGMIDANKEVIRSAQKVTVSCYHSRDGLYSIETKMISMLRNHTFTFRTYAYMGTGAYIICERRKK